MSCRDRGLSWWAKLATVRRCIAAVLMLMLITVSFVPSAIAVSYNKETLEGRDFSNQDLRDASFTKASVRDVNFSGSDLTGVSFFSANLERANLTGANLTNSTLDTARITQSNLTNAILEGAFAFNTKFDGAVIDGADFTDMQMRDDTRLLLCKSAAGVNPTTQRETRETLFCDE